MREAELAALSDEFFEPEFDQGSATLIGSPVNTEELGGRTITFLRPDARSLARAEVYSVPAPDADGDIHPFVEDLVLVLRGARIYSRATLEEFFGKATKSVGPSSEDGEPSSQLEFPQDRTIRGVIIVRWWPDADDPEAHGEVYGPDEIRVEELHLRRFLPGMDHTSGNTIPPGEADLLDDDEVEADDGPPEPEVDLDEAMDTGAWVAELAWRILRPDFDITRAFDLLGTGESDSAAYDQRIVLRPRDPRLELAIVTVLAEQVSSVRLDMPEDAALALALDAVSDRLNALPSFVSNTLQYRFESTRSRGAVTLVLGRGAQRGPVVRITAMEVNRG